MRDKTARTARTAGTAGLPALSLDRRGFLLGMGGLFLLAQGQDADVLRWPNVVQDRSPVDTADNEALITAVERRLKCTCGCNLDVFTCRTTDFTCSYSPQLHREVMALHEAGRAPEEIVTAFVDRYGEQILMAPKPVGFNLAGYLVPGIAVLLAGTILAVVLLRRQRQVAARAAGASSALRSAVQDGPADSEPSPEDLERLRRALSEVAD